MCVCVCVCGQGPPIGENAVGLNFGDACDKIVHLFTDRKIYFRFTCGEEKLC